MNQYRCETCKKRLYENPEDCPCEKDYEPLLEHRVSVSDIELIMSISGCASHSDFDPHEHAIQNAITFACENHDKDIQQKEREKALDEFMNKIVSSRFGLDDGLLVVRMSDVRVIREELRHDRNQEG